MHNIAKSQTVKWKRLLLHEGFVWIYKPAALPLPRPGLAWFYKVVVVHTRHMYCTICSHFVERSGKGTCAVPALHSLHLAARALFLRRLLRVEHHARRGARRGGSLRQLARDLVKQVVDIRRRFGRRLHKEESILFGIRGRLLCLHPPPGPTFKSATKVNIK